MARHGTLELALTGNPRSGRRAGAANADASLRHGSPQLVDHPETRCFVCGPSSLVNDVPVMLHALGIPRKLITVESW